MIMADDLLLLKGFFHLCCKRIAIFPSTVRSSIDFLIVDVSASEKQENTEIIPTLHELYTITFTPQGRQAAIQVICMEQNLETLLQLVEKKGCRNVVSHRKNADLRMECEHLEWTTWHCKKFYQLIYIWCLSIPKYLTLWCM